MPFRASSQSSWNGGASTTQLVGTNGRAWAQVAGAFVALSALASQLPSPRATLDTLFGARSAVGAGGVGAGGTGGGGGASGVADAAMLSVAAVSVWLLLIWVTVISVVAVTSRLPGVVGSAARAGLVALAPVAVRNVLLTVVGASVVTGLAGCATVGTIASPVSTGPAGPVAVGTSNAASAAPGSATAIPDLDATGSTSASQLLAERLVGIATLRISDRIAVEGSAVRSAGAEPADGGGNPAPSLDWPATAASATPTATPVPAVGTAAPAAAAGTSATGAGTAATGAATGTSAPATGTSAPATGTSAPAASTARSRSSPAPAPAPDGPTAGSATRPAVPTVSVDWPGPAARSADSADTSVVVLKGDSLWTIAARSLPAGADDAAIDRTWHAWYAANTSVIGSDPNYLLPGQILQPPTTGTGTP